MKKFFNGVNYWASHAGIDMWREWSAEAVESDMKEFVSLGMDTLRVFPLWRDFQPITPLFGGAGTLSEISHGEKFLDDGSEESKAGVCPVMMEHFEEFCDLAEKYNFKIIVGMITGWMSGRTYCPPAMTGRNLITDPFCVKWQVRFIKYFIKRFKSRDCIIAWELGNECNVLAAISSADEAYRWTQCMTDAMRSVDSTRPIYSGMHSLAEFEGAWQILDQAELCDVLTTHPYPIFTRNCELDPLVSPRCILHAAAETTLYADIGKRECFVEEIGYLSPCMGGEEVIAQFVHANLFNALAHNSTGFLWWLGYDCAHKKLNVAPYDWCEVERELGLLDVNGNWKKSAYAYSEFTSFLKDFPYQEVPARNKNAVCILNPDNWDGAFGSFLLAKRSGLEISYANKKMPINDESKLYILPGGNEFSFIRFHIYEKLLEKVANGATLLITYDKQMISPFDKVVGCTSLGRRKSKELKFELDGETLTMPRDFMFELVPTTAEVVLSDSEGFPLLTKNPYGKGTVLFFNGPLERFFATEPFVPSETKGYEKIYTYAKNCAGIQECVEKTNVLTAITIHKIDDKKSLVFVLNNSREEQRDSFVLNGVKITKIYRGNIDAEKNEMVIPVADAVIFEVEK